MFLFVINIISAFSDEIVQFFPHIKVLKFPINLVSALELLNLFFAQNRATDAIFSTAKNRQTHEHIFICQKQTKMQNG